MEAAMLRPMLWTILASWTAPGPAPAAVAGPPPAHDARDADVSYVVRPRVEPDRTVLEVSMSLTGDADGVTRIALPRGGYGTPRLHECVTELRVEGADATRVEGDDALRDLRHEPHGQIEVRYVLSWDPAAHPGVAYRPSVGPSHFHFFEPQWRVSLPDRTERSRYAFRFDGVPEGWVAFGNMGVGPGPHDFVATEETFPGFIAGGDYQVSSFTSDGTPVRVYVRGDFEDPEALAGGVRAAIDALSGTFGSLDLPFYVVSISERPRIRAGTAIDNAFVCLVSPTTPDDQLLRLITHETLHRWLPGAATIEGRHASDLDEYRLDWFLEGFTEYCARRVLLDAGLVEPAAFVEWFNDDLVELARNPKRNASLQDVGEAIAAGGYTNRHERLSYTRGPLLALAWDHAQAQAGREPVASIVRDFVRDAVESGGTLPEAALFDLLERNGIDARSDYERAIVRGEPIVPPAGAFGRDVRRIGHEVVRYEPGFDVRTSLERGTVTGVDPAGPAHEAGMRDGMSLADFDTEREPDRPVRATVDGGRVIEYLPREMVPTVRFVPRE
jgi:predicted metalloprotease with PDZ domain